MALLLKKLNQDNSVLGIWEMTEDENSLLSLCNLTNEDIDLLDRIKSKTRRIEILATRVLIKSLDLDISINYEGRKPICNNGFISISHSDELVCIIWHPNLQTTIDIERIDERIARISKRAFSDSELAFASNDLKILTILWNCKEAVYKICNKQVVDFKLHIKVLPFKLGDKISCEFINNNTITNFEFYYSDISNQTYVWGLK